MRSLGTYVPPETVGLQFTRLAVPKGREMPRAPVLGELFTMEADPPEPLNNSPWYLKGTYVFNGTHWVRLSDSLRRRQSQAIGSQKIEIEVAGSTSSKPSWNSGYVLSAINVQPTNIRAFISGTAAAWVDITKSGYVWLSVFRESQLVGFVVEFVDANKPKTLSLTFTDLPVSKKPVTYTLKANTDQLGYLYVNQCSKFNFDGASQTAFTVAEDN
jgi:hypothetical protein